MRRASKLGILALAGVATVAGSIAILASAAAAEPPSATAPAPADLTAPQVLAKVRAALGLQQIQAKGLMATGAGALAGIEGTYSLTTDGRGQFAIDFHGQIGRVTGFDGATVWEIDDKQVSRVLALGDRDRALLLAWFIGGYWASERAPLEISLAAEQADEKTIRVRVDMKDSPGFGVATIDRGTWLPRGFTLEAGGGPATITVDGYFEHDGVKFPKSVGVQTNAGSESAFTFEKLSPCPTFIRNPFELRKAAPTDTVFDPAATPNLELRKAPTGHLLVKVSIDGHDAEWFIFDTGAGADCIDPEFAKKYSLEPFGTLPTMGIGGAVLSSFWQGKSLAIGPAKIDAPVMVGVDLNFLTPYMGVRVAGIAGYGVLARVVAELDTFEGSVALHDPSTYTLPPAAAWTPIALYDRHPCIEGQFEGHTGWFRLDTGAANTSITFHEPTVTRLKLLDGRETTTTMLGGVGGAVKARAGALKTISFAGKTWNNVNVGFATESKGAFSDKYTAGNVGGQLLAPFRLVADYQNGRMAFILRDAGK